MNTDPNHWSAELADAKSATKSPLYELSSQSIPAQTTLDSIVLRLYELIFREQPSGASLASQIQSDMHSQIELAYRMDSPLMAQQSAQEKSIIVTSEFFATLPRLYRTLLTDIRAAYDGDPAAQSTQEIVLCYPGLWAVMVQRMSHELYRLKVPLIPRMMAEAAHMKTGIDIHPGAIIGTHFFVDHGTGVVVGETCQIGNHVKIYQGVTLGASSFQVDVDGKMVRGLKRHPTIEDNVVVYANATILGGRTVIGRDCVIGSNVWLTSSVAPNTTVVMEKPSLRMRRHEDEFSGSFDFQI